MKFWDALLLSKVEQVCKPNSVSRCFRIVMAIIHLVQLLPDWIKRSTRRSYPDESEFGRAALLTPPYLILHCEEFAWPHVSPHTPVRPYFKPLRAAPFHPSPQRAGLLSVALVVARILDFNFEIQDAGRPAVSGLAAL